MRRFALIASALIATACGTPNIASECTMNGFGNGQCSFTNTGTAAGSACGKIVVVKNDGTDRKESSTFCSGSVEPKSTNKVEFTVILDGLCESGTLGAAWSDVCGFDFLTQ